MHRRRQSHPTLAPALALAAALGAAACAGAPPVPPPPPPPVEAAPALPPLPEGIEARLDEAAGLLADGADLPRVARLLASVGPEVPRRELLLGQLAELVGDDGAAEAAYARYLLTVDDDEVRLRRALVLERLGRGAEVAGDLARLRPAPREPAPPPAAQKRKLRPLLPSAR